jgi:hypothetical protein
MKSLGFVMQGSQSKHVNKKTREYSAETRSYNWNRRVAPSGVALSSNG